MPPHSLYVEPFLGLGAVIKRKLPARASIVIDSDADRIAEFGEGGPNVRVIHGDALKVLPTLKLPNDALIYADPPYVLSSRQHRRYYRCELTDAQHGELLNVLTSLSCYVMLSGYPSELYASRLASWREVKVKVSTRRGPRMESLWCNFPEPERLHDWNSFGTGFRERERLRRRLSRFMARLQAMDGAERNYLLTAAIAKYGERSLTVSSGEKRSIP